MRKCAKYLLFGILTIAGSPNLTLAQLSDRPLKIVLPFGAGGNGDITARLIADKLRAI